MEQKMLIANKLEHTARKLWVKRCLTFKYYKAIPEISTFIAVTTYCRPDNLNIPEQTYVPK